MVLAKKYQVFVSSTFRDLVEERQDAIRNILDLQHIPAGMELFPASDVDQLAYIKKVIDECDYYLLIVGGRYGSMDADGISYTEREYDYAVATGKFVLAFVHDDPASITVGKSDVDPAVAKALNLFRGKVMTGRLVRTWRTREGLEPLVLKALMHAFSDAPQVGWVRADTIASETALTQANEALRENASLRQRIAQYEAVSEAELGEFAGLDEVFNVGYGYTWQGSSRHTSETFTWKELAIGFGSALTTTTNTALAVKHAVIFALNRKDRNPSSVSVDTVAAKTIRIQMEVLGIVIAKVLGTTNGGQAEFLSLTPKGKALFMREMVARPAKS